MAAVSNPVGVCSFCLFIVCNRHNFVLLFFSPFLIFYNDDLDAVDTCRFGGLNVAKRAQGPSLFTRCKPGQGVCVDSVTSLITGIYQAVLTDKSAKVGLRDGRCRLLSRQVIHVLSQTDNRSSVKSCVHELMYISDR